MNRRIITSITLFLIAFVIAVYQGVIARSVDDAGSPSDEAAYEAAFGAYEADDGTYSYDDEDEDERSNTNATVTNVVDGDTIDVVLDEGFEARIRFLGVNTPETVDPRRPVECFGAEASNYAKTILSGERVLLEADPQADERDRYGRLLRNVFLADGTDVNALLVERGYAYAYLGFPMDPERKAELKRLENRAREGELGLWSPDACR